jgi:hypothetical protein
MASFFNLTVRLANSHMQSSSDVVFALDKLGATLEHDQMEPGSTGKVFDVNGNSVGQWRIEAETTAAVAADMTEPDIYEKAAAALWYLESSVSADTRVTSLKDLKRLHDRLVAAGKITAASDSWWADEEADE